MSDDPAPVLQYSPPLRLRRLPSWLVNQLALRATRLVAQGSGNGGVRSTFAVLAGLEEAQPVSQADLSRRLGMDRADVVHILNRLEQDDLVRRSPDPANRRRNAVTLTAEGERMLDRLQEQIDRAQEDLLEPLTTAEREQLTELLGRLVDHHAAVRAAS